MARLHPLLIIALLSEIMEEEVIASILSKVPKVVVIIDENFIRENQNIPAIFERHNKFISPNISSVLFEIVVATNDSTTLPKVCEKLQTGIVALLDMTSPNVTSLLRPLAIATGMAYISVVDDSYFRNTWIDESLHFRFEPSAVQLLRIVTDIVRIEELNNVALIYDDTFGIHNSPKRLLTNIPAQHIYMQIGNSENETLRQVEVLREIGIKSIFLIASSRNVQAFLRQMATKGREADPRNIFILSKDSSLTCDGCGTSTRLVTIATEMSEITLNNYIKFIRDNGINENINSSNIKVDEAMTFDLALLIRKAMPSSVFPVVYNNCADVTSGRIANPDQDIRIINALKQTQIDGVFGWLGHREGHTSYNLTLVLQEIMVESGNITNQTYLGQWTRDLGLHVSPGSLTLVNKKRHYRVVTVPEVPPLVYKDLQTNTTGQPSYYGYCIELLDAIAEILQFDYEIYESPDGQVGTMFENGSWNGVINELIQKRADIAIGPISVMAEREHVVDFTVPFYDLVGLTILMKKPKFDYSLVKFLSVLDGGVWGCIIGAFFVFSVLMWVFDKLSPFSYQNNRMVWDQEGPEPRVFTFKEGIWFCMMSLTPQGGGETPKALSGRLVAATWWLFGFIIIATYTANLAAFLTVSRLETTVKSLDDLSKQTKITYAPQNGSSAHIYFYRMAEIEKTFHRIWKEMSLSDDMSPVERAKLAVWDYPISDKYTKLWKTMTASPFPQDQNEAIQRVLHSDFAFVADATVNKYATLTNCDVVQVGEELSRKPYALAVQEGSVLRSELSDVILHLINQRKLEEIKTKWWDRDKVDCPVTEDESDGISIRNIGGVFLVIVIGAALALLMLVLECYWYKFRNKSGKRRYNVSSQTVLTNDMSSASSLPNGNKTEDSEADGPTTCSNDDCVEVADQL